MDESASKLILELLQSKDDAIEELNEEKMVLMEQLEQALWDLEHAITHNNSVAARASLDHDDVALHIDGQLRALEHQVSDLKLDVATANTQHGMPVIDHTTSHQQGGVTYPCSENASSYTDLDEQQLHHVEEMEPKPTQQQAVSTLDTDKLQRHFASNKEELAESQRQLHASETEAMTLLQSLQRSSETVRAIDMQHQRALAVQAHEHATVVATWQAKVTQLQLDKQQLPQFGVESISHHPSKHQSGGLDEVGSTIPDQPLIHKQLLHQLQDLQAQNKSLAQDIALEMQTSRVGRDHIARLERQVDDLAAVVAAQDNVQEALESRASCAIALAARALPPATMAVSPPVSIDDWVSILTDLWEQQCAATNIIAPANPLENVYATTLCVCACPPRVQQNSLTNLQPPIKSMECHRSLPTEDENAPDNQHHMCTWYLQAKKWQLDVQTLQLAQCSHETLAELRQAKASSDSDATAARAAHLTMRKKMSILQADVDATKQALVQVKSELRASARDRSDMEHMVSRLRDESSRLKDSLRRKQELVSHLKRSFEEAKRALDEEKNQRKVKPDANTRCHQLAQQLQAQVVTLKTDKEHLRTRCATLLHAVKLKDKLLQEHSTVAAQSAGESGGGGGGATLQPLDANAAMVKEMKRRLHQKQVLVEALKHKDAAVKGQLLALQKQHDRLQAKLHWSKLGTYIPTKYMIDCFYYDLHGQYIFELDAIAPSIVVEPTQADVDLRRCLDGLRACVYDVAHDLLFPTSDSTPVQKRIDVPSTPGTVSQQKLQALGLTYFSPTDLEALTTVPTNQNSGTSHRKKTQVLDALEQALEGRPDDCRHALLEVFHAATDNSSPRLRP
ncbi:hypothetical protein B5M09_010393 [Aphanomyces astaci]|uniref:Uncharacterized protein n=1 Tax=Aphanomyces astaci TaxID=112090 RepID=A0A425DLD1_APHAT|nr:hypothetical protein B5M09_010393 [Aphanomyces astaci]